MISVVVATRDRAEALAHTLARLAAQQPPPGGFEVVVVDNGSSDGTPAAVERAAASYPVPLTFLSEPRPGPAAARNRGVERSAGETVLLLGDDMEPARDDLLVRHAAFHAAHDDGWWGLLGRATWHPGRPVTPFMRWLERSMQFAFDRLERGEVPAGPYLYTPNLSLPRALLLEAGGFDERFPYAAVEDMELGVRLEARGLRLWYDPDVLVLHDHPTDLPGSLRRLERVGQSGRLYRQLHPERPLKGLPDPSGPLWTALGLAQPAARLLGHPRIPAPVRERAWFAQHLAAYARGYRRGGL